MKTRFKIFLVIACFVGFYFTLIPVLQFCLNSNDDCLVWQELMLLTRPVIASGDLQWSGSVDGIEIPSLSDQLIQNLPFAISMLVLQFVIIGFVVVWDNRK
jgi:hypothetical protein